MNHCKSSISRFNEKEKINEKKQQQRDNPTHFIRQRKQ